MTEPGSSGRVEARSRWRLWLAKRVIYPWWTQTEIDAAKWRGHEQWLRLGFGVKHGVDEPCPIAGRCGGVMPRLLDGAPMFCALPHGHDGWHKGDDGAEWSHDV